MKLFGFLRPVLSRLGMFAPRGASRRWVGAGYDAARTNSENSKHWQAADTLGPRASNNPAVRRVLRSRSRYETCNNNYALGLTRTLANDVIGTGPRLQVKAENQEFCTAVENEFAAWAKVTDLAGKLRTMREAQAVDGEAFAQLANNGGLPTRVKLDVRQIEAECVASPFDSVDDGIRFDQWGNPEFYDVLKSHPGELSVVGLGSAESYPVAAANMIHIFRRGRPGQTRGIPETTAALPLFALLRRFTLAVVAAAEAIAEIGTGVVYSDQAPAQGNDATPYEQIELERRMLTVLPDGWKMNQLKPEQPTSTYAEFKREILSECSRGWSMPFNITACNSSGYNYASGRLDHQTYYKQIAVERFDYETKVLDRIFAAWLAEALLIPGYLPPIKKGATVFAFMPGVAAATAATIGHVWFWDGSAHVDPAKEAAAQAQRLANLTTSLAAEYGAVGKDWEVELEQIARERKALKKHQLALPTTGNQSEPADKPETDEDAEDPEPAEIKAFDPNQERDERGRFDGGGGDTSKKEQRDREDSETTDRWDQETDELLRGHEKQQAELDEKHSTERAFLVEQHDAEKKDLREKHRLERSGASTDEERISLGKKQFEESEDLADRQGDDRAKLERRQERENSRLMTKQDREIDALRKKQDAEDREIDQRRAKEDRHAQSQ